LQQPLALDEALFALVRPNDATTARINRKYFIDSPLFSFRINPASHARAGRSRIRRERAAVAARVGDLTEGRGGPIRRRADPGRKRKKQRKRPPRK
jgi:hypothetical protein